MDLSVSTDLALLDQMPVGLAIYDDHGVLVHANSHFDRLVSCPRLPSCSIAGPSRWVGRAPDGTALPLAAFPCRRALRGETVVPGIDLLLHLPDGSRHCFTISAAPIVDPLGGAVVGIVLLFLDAGEPSGLARSLKDSAFQFARFAESSDDAIWIVDAETEAFEYRNPAHADLSGDQGGGIGHLRDWLDRIAEQDRREVRRRYDEVLAGGTAHVEYDVRRGDEPSRRVRETSFPIRDDAGAVAMIGGIATDVTPVVQAPLYLVGRADGASGDDPLPFLRRRREPIKRFATIGAFLDIAAFLAPGCVLLDARSAGDGADQFDRALKTLPPSLPVVILGRADAHISNVLDAMRAGAVDYLIPPVVEDAIRTALHSAARRLTAQADRPAAAADVDDRLARLSKREREVLSGLAIGGTNKSIGRSLGISPRTVELHRARLMERMNASSLADLLRTARIGAPRTA